MSGSVRGRRWLVREAVPGGGIPGRDCATVVERLLALRGVTTKDDARRFLHGAPSAADPADIPGMGKAVQRILAGIRGGERIAVYGDYDVDGVTATAILCEGLRDLGGEVAPHIPNRFADGYGLTRAGIRAVRDLGANLLISVDCGINANPEVEYAAELGIAVVILDHHEPPATLPDADAIVDPKLGGGPPEFDGLASCGLAYTTLRALYTAAGRSLDEDRCLDLAALGTVADMVPLLGENRRIVRDGLRAIARRRRPGLHALCEAAGVDPSRLTADSIGFRLAPRLNAAGRLADAGLALELLTTSDDGRAAELASTLNELNARRQQMTEEAVTLARGLADADGADSPLIMVGHADIAQGIVGLVAGRLADERYRPAIVYERSEDVCRGSVRSIREVDVVRCLSQGASLMERWGGHSQAGGFSVRPGRLAELKRVLSEWVAGELDGADLRPVLEADLEVGLREIGGKDIQWLPYFEPCGQENPAPVFVSRNLPVMQARTMGSEGRHLRMKLRDGVATWDAVAFNMGHAAPRPGTRIDLMYSLARDRRGAGLELHLRDFAPSE